MRIQGYTRKDGKKVKGYSRKKTKKIFLGKHMTFGGREHKSELQQRLKVHSSGTSAKDRKAVERINRTILAIKKRQKRR